MAAAYPSPRTLLERYGLRAKKSWGQNFLGDEGVLEHIAALAVERAGDRVLELGAGLGHLTARLIARGGRVVAVERDRDMARVLRGELGGRTVVLEADAARLDLAALARAWPGPVAAAISVPTPPPSPLPALRARGGGEERTLRAQGGGEGVEIPTDRIAVVGNLPYHLTSPILFSLLDQVACLSRGVFLLQREVAERLAAPPGSRDWGILSVLLQREAEVQVTRVVPRSAFLPPPKVESAVLRAVFRPPIDLVIDPARFRRLVKAGFGQRRKTLRNALEAGRVAEPARLAEALACAGVDPGRRGETLTLAEWAAVERALG